MLDQLAQRLAHLPDRAIIAIDGVDGAGKTTFADQLGLIIVGKGRRVLRAGVDGFHHPKARRCARGKSDPLGFFLDSYDYEALSVGLLEPFKRGQDTVETARFDHKSDESITQRVHAPPRPFLSWTGFSCTAMNFSSVGILVFSWTSLLMCPLRVWQNGTVLIPILLPKATDGILRAK